MGPPRRRFTCALSPRRSRRAAWRGKEEFPQAQALPLFHATHRQRQGRRALPFSCHRATRYFFGQARNTHSLAARDCIRGHPADFATAAGSHRPDLVGEAAARSWSPRNSLEAAECSRRQAVRSFRAAAEEEAAHSPRFGLVVKRVDARPGVGPIRERAGAIGAITVSSFYSGRA